MKIDLLLSLRVIFIFVVKAFQPPFLPMSFTPKKRGREIVYFRLLSARKATMTIAAIAATSTIATSVVIKGVAGVSGVIGPEGEIAGSTVMYVIACDP